MFRTVLACALAATVAADGHMEAIAAAAKGCNDTYAAGAADCDTLLELGHCLANVGVSALPATSQLRYDFEHSLILAQKDLGCVEHKDASTAEAPTINADSTGSLALDVHEEHELRAVRFKRNILSLYSMTQQIAKAEEDCADDHFAAGEIDIAKSDLATANSSMSENVDTFVANQSAVLSDMVDEAYDTINSVADTVNSKRANLTVMIDGVTEALTTGLDEKIAALKEDTMGKLRDYLPAQTWANSTGDRQYTREYQLVQVATSPADTENNHAGRIMYKINFNPNNPGFWYPNRRELRRACSALNEDLKNAKCPNNPSATDGIDRGIKPACDHDNSHYCDGNAVRMNGAYLSHCGCGGYPRKRQCVGMTNNFLRGAVMYNRENSWNGCWMLRHDGRDCHHHWTDCWNRRSITAIHTICTSSNAHFKKAPFAGCA